MAASVAVIAIGVDRRTAPSDEQRYEQWFQAALDRYQSSPGRQAGADASLARQAESARQAVLLVRRLAEDLAALRAPADVARAHRRFVAGLRGVSDDMARLARAMMREDRARVESLLSRPGGFVRPVNARAIVLARQEFEREGYSVGLERLPFIGGA